MNIPNTIKSLQYIISYNDMSIEVTDKNNFNRSFYDIRFKFGDGYDYDFWFGLDGNLEDLITGKSLYSIFMHVL